MTPWERLKKEMVKKRKSDHDLAQATGASLSAIWHWQHRGIPSKHMRGCADMVGRSVQWLELGVDPLPDLQSAVQAIALHLESLGEYDHATVLALFSTLTTSPQQFEVVATGLESLPKQEP